MSGALCCENYAFSLSGVPILQGICFSLEKGAYLSIIGPNGAGKSTLLKSFLRLHDGGRQTGGIYILGRPLATYNQRELARLIAYVPQAGGRVPPFTIEEFLKLSRYPYASTQKGLRPADMREVDRALELTRMTHFAGRRLDTLSGGERQKAYLAAALAQGADIFLLDEPASFLDPKHAAELNALLKTLNHEHKLTMLTVTHDLNHPLDVGGQTLVVRQGGQLYFGPSEALAKEGVLERAFEHTFTYLTHPRTGKALVLADQP